MAKHFEDELETDYGTVLFSWSLEDESFDHEFGTEFVEVPQLNSWGVIDAAGRDITATLSREDQKRIITRCEEHIADEAFNERYKH